MNVVSLKSNQYCRSSGWTLHHHIISSVLKELKIKIQQMNRNWKRPQLFHRNMSAGSWWGRTASPCSSAATSSSSAANAWLAAPPTAGPHSSWPRRRPQPIGGRRQTAKVWNWSKRDDQIPRFNSFLLPDKHTFRFVVPKKLISWDETN